MTLLHGLELGLALLIGVGIGDWVRRRWERGRDWRRAWRHITLLSRGLQELLTAAIENGQREERIMGQLEELTAVLGEARQAATEVAEGIGAQGAKVETLIGLLQAHPAAPDLTAAITEAQGIAQALTTAKTALAAIPPVPTG